MLNSAVMVVDHTILDCGLLILACNKKNAWCVAVNGGKSMAGSISLQRFFDEEDDISLLRY